MFKNMKLGTKIAAGFGALIVIAMILGGLAVWSMTRVKTVATNLVAKQVPEVAVANDVERSSLTTMFQVRGYVYTDETKFLEDGRKELALVKENLTKAKEHAVKHDIALLKQNAEKAEAKALEYETLLGQTVAATDAMAKDKEGMNASATKYMAVCSAYLDSQDKQQNEEYKTVTATSQAGNGTAKMDWQSKLEDRAWKKTVANNIIDLGNAIRIGAWKSMVLRDPKLIQEAQKKFTEINKDLDALKAKTIQEADLKSIEECRMAGKAYSDDLANFLTNWLAREELNKKRNDVADAVLLAARETAQGGMDETTKGATQAASSLTTASTTMIIGLLVALLLGIGLAVTITLSITRPIRRVIAGLTSGSEQTSSASGQVAQSSQSMAQGAAEQASSLEETSASLEEITSMTQQNAENANQAKKLANEANQSADKGTHAMVKMNQAIDDIKKSSDSTAKIIKTIDEIAFQTNLLALNAAVEAARAGESGKGFAVVAEEVRNLARRSADAAKNTSAMIEESVKNAANGVVISREVGEALTEIAEAARKVNALVGEIAGASTEQAKGIDQVNTAVAEMDKVTQQNAAHSEESASAAEELSAQAEEMRRMVDELVAMVGGASAGATGTQRAGYASGPARVVTQAAPVNRRPMVKAAPARKMLASTAAAGNGRRNASDVIPLDDDDLATF